MFVIALSSVSALADQRDFTLHNGLGFTIKSVHVSESTNSSWEADVLGSSVLIDGESTPIRFTGYADGVCRFDVKITDMEDRAWFANGIDLCTISDLEFYLARGEVAYRTPTARPSRPSVGDARDFRIHNKLDFTVKTLHVSETTNSSWESDLLGDTVLGADEVKPVTFSGYADGVCRFDIKVTDMSDDAWTLSNVDLCSITDVDLLRVDGKVTFRTYLR